MVGNWPKQTLWRLRGIPIRIDATFIFVPLFFYGWAASRSGNFSWPMVVLGTFGVFFSVLVHEIGHALTAKRLQVGVTEIVVGGFFGYASLKRQAISRKVLIRVLAGGPFANLALFALLWIGLSFFSQLGAGPFNLVRGTGPGQGWAVETLRILALINLTMFIFNMLPAFPLDGGRMLGLFLDRHLSARRSRVIVSTLGLAMGTAMILFGLGISLILSAIGFLIVMTNLRRLQRRRKPVT